MSPVGASGNEASMILWTRCTGIFIIMKLLSDRAEAKEGKVAPQCLLAGSGGKIQIPIFFAGGRCLKIPEKSVVQDMTQDTAASRSVPDRKKQSAPPGIGLAIAIAVLSGVVSWYWLESGRANPPGSSAADVSDLREVEEPDIAGALSSMSLSNAARAQFRAGQDGGCRPPLAWVSMVSAPGEAPSHIRLISGTYYSPVFAVSATPVRVALPFPAPYDTGHGILTAIDVGGSVSISLLPAWRVSAQDGKTTRAVTWHPVKNCRSRNG